MWSETISIGICCMELANTHPKRFAVIAREGWNKKRSDFLRDCIYTFYGMQGAALGLRVLSRSDVVWKPSKRLGGGFPVAGANLPHN